MDLIGFIQVFNIIVMAIGTLLYLCCRPFSSSSSSSAADSAADDDVDIPPRRQKYDVFISFRGEDTRLGITSHLHAALLQKKIETYIDDKLQSGEEIRPALLEAIEKSKISVIIFSQNYASSKWCLDELVQILKCKERYGQMVIPVFYDINPSDVRNQRGSYKDAFAQHEKRFDNNINKVHKWRDALTTAANLSGLCYSNKFGTEAVLIKNVVDHIWTKLICESSCDLEGLVGIESRIQQIEELLGIDSQDACITVGIWGMGGIGKTTLAEAVFHRHSSKFKASCFLKNVRENSEQTGGLDHLEKTLLKEILKVEGLPVGSTFVRERLSRTKVLIVLDDVSDSMQLERLAGNRLLYGTGSRIIITTRDRSTLGQTVEEDNIYEVELLKLDDALQLFCSRAFKNNSTRRTDYEELAEKVVAYAKGVPLALTVLGSLFFNCKSKEEWEDEFNKLKLFPSESIQKVLRISYDRLEKNEKEIFLDIAVADCAAVADDEDADIPPRREKYDVFISFRGVDTRFGITSHLHAALLQKKIDTYTDDGKLQSGKEIRPALPEAIGITSHLHAALLQNKIDTYTDDGKLQSGKEIRPALLEAIEKSKISVIIFSQNYASSKWCLDELVQILKCKERYGQMVIPVFYDINPSDVRNQRGSYEDAFAQHEKRFNNNIYKVHKWRDALTTAANLSGFDYSNKFRTEAYLIKNVVDLIWTKLICESSCYLEGLVGIESRIQQIEELLGIVSQDACITVGIWGMGGIGKTTLAKAVFHRHSSKFEASCFLKNVRENSEQTGGLDHLEKILLKEILKEEVLPVGSTFVRERLSRTKVLIVLDDVSDSMQLERLAGNRLLYGTGSRIIITTRDRSTLGQTVEEDNIYKVEVLKPDDALQLFCSRAFKNNSTRRRDYEELAEKVVHYARGVPLALTVLGSLFFNCKSKEDWEDEFNKLKRFPSESIQKVLRISYDRLDKNEKEIFLDIACFHKGWHVEDVKRILVVRGFFATIGIRILVDMSLISIDSKWGAIEMHDLLQEMGRAIVQEQCIKEPFNWNRLFTNEDVYRALKSNTETPNVEAIEVNWYNLKERPLKLADFKKMSNVTMLRSFDSSVADCAAVADDEDGDIPPRREYDVFISFRDEDTRHTFTSHLHDALLQKKIETYMDKDNRLQRGDEIGPALLEAIEKSTISVIVFSQNYASSTWCLDELVHILKCKERYGQMVIPVFYRTNASDVRKQHRSYGDAFAQHQKRFKDSIDKVHKWTEALTTAANLSGFHHSENAGTDADLIKEVVKDIWTKLCRKSSYDLKGLVGIESRIEQIKSLLSIHSPDLVGIESHIEQIESLLGIHSPDTCITVGIWGMDGIGKTTLAEAVFHRHSSKFEASCFVKNVRKNSEQADGLDRLENELLKEILKEEVLPRGSTRVRKGLSRTKVLIVLDDVSDSMQMERLAGDRLRYGTGSRIIITSRDSRTLGQTVDKIYEVQGLKLDDALQLFCSSAFKNNSTRRTDYKELAEKAVDYAQSVPLALTVLGSLFFNCKSKQDWENEFNKLKRFPGESIQTVLRLSYDGLERHEKEIFLDLACFHQGRHVDMVKRMLDVRGFFARAGIRFLIDMSLISTDSKRGRETIEMHDLLEEMGRTIVQEQCIEDPGKRNRLFTDEDVYRVLKNNWETPIVQAIRVNWSKIEEHPLKRANFKKMSNLIMLIVDNSGIFDCKFTASLDLPDSLRYLEWRGYPLKYLPLNFCPENLVELHMPCSKVKKLWKEEQILVNLQVIDLSNSEYLTEVPNLSGSLKIVEINLWGCESLVEIPLYFQHLDKLTHLDLGACRSLKYLPEMPGNIQYLDLQYCDIKELPESVWSNENISYLNITYCEDLKKLPSSKCKLKNLEKLDLYSCSKFENFPEILEPMEHLKSLSLIQTAVTELPSSICKLKYLESLCLDNCFRFSKFPEILKPMEHLVSLSLQDTAVEMLPSSIGNLIRLQDLNLRFCKQLKDVPTSIYSFTNLEHLHFNGCRKLKKLPSSSVGFLSLETLELSYSGILEIPASIKQASRLSILNVINCKRLQSIPELPVLCNVKAQGCTSLKIVSSSRTALAQGWDKPYYCFKVFTNCPKLDNNSRSSIMDEAQITIMRMATIAPFKEQSYWLNDPWPQINIVCPGKKIPNWFSYQNEESSVDIELRPDWFRTGLFGFALSIVVSSVSNRWVRANFIVKFMGESHELFSSEYIIPGDGYDDYCDGQHHVHVWNEAFRSEEVGKNCSPDVYKLAKEASVVFCLEDAEDFEDYLELAPASPMKVESCGICPLYAEDAEKFKFDHVFMLREPKVEDKTTEGGGSRDEPEASGSRDESEANESDEHGSKASGTEDDSDF